MSNQEPQAEQIFVGALELRRRRQAPRLYRMLLREVKSLLAAHEKVGTFLEMPADGAALGGPASEPAGTPGTAVGDGYYLMLAPLSRGQRTIHYGGTFHFEAGEISEDPLDFPKDIRFDLTVG